MFWRPFHRICPRMSRLEVFELVVRLGLDPTTREISTHRVRTYKRLVRSQIFRQLTGRAWAFAHVYSRQQANLLRHDQANIHQWLLILASVSAHGGERTDLIQ